MSSTKGVQGIVSGNDTTALIKATLQSQQNLIDDLETKSLELDVEEQAYLAVNTYVQTFSTSVEAVATAKLWDTLAATSSKEDSLTATIDDTAVEGTYTFEVLQLAQAAQATSTGVSSKTSAVTPSGSGSITIESSKAQLAQETLLSSLNGGQGVSHGIIKITNAAGVSAAVDLRGALTMQDVIDKINDSGLSVAAALSSDGNGLTLTDSSSASGSLVITDSTGSAADDLGIKGTHAARTVTGSGLYGLNANTALAELRDGLGVNNGEAGTINISDGTSNWDVDLSKCTTIGQVVSTINGTSGITVTASLSSDGRSIVMTGAGGSNLTITSVAPATTTQTNTTAEDLGIAVTAGGASVTGGKIMSDMNSVQLMNLSGASGTGLNGTAGEYGQSLGSFTVTFADGDTIVYDLDAAGVKSDDSLSDLLKYLNAKTSTAGTKTLTFGLNDTGNGIQLTNTTGSAVSGIANTTGTIATDLGLAGQTVANNAELDGGDLDLKYISRATSLSTLNSGAGVKDGSFTLTDAAGYSAEIEVEADTTIGDVIDSINAANLKLTARINDTGDGIILESKAGTTGGTIKVEEENGGTVAADLGFLRKSTLNGTQAVLDGSFEVNISVDTDDSLTDIMSKINDQTNLNAYIMSDGSAYSPYRLVIASETTGAASDFMVSTDISSLGFSKTATGQDSLLLYGSESAGSEPLLTASSTNTNNSTVIGMTLNLAAISEGKVTISLSRDNEAITEALQAVVDAYNELKSLVADMMKYVEEDDTSSSNTSYTGLLYGDNNTRVLMNQITSLFTTSVSNNGIYRTFTDLGISFDLDESTDDAGNSSYSTQMVLDEDTLTELLNSNFKDVRSFFVHDTNAALATEGASASTNCTEDVAHPLANLIDGDTTGDDYFLAGDTIANGDNAVTVTFKGPVLMDYLTIYFENKDTSLKDFKVEYLNSDTGKWETLREKTGNSSAYSVIAPENSVRASAIRLTASATNAADGKLRIAEIAVKAENGVGSSMTTSLNKILDSEYGYAITESNKVDEQQESIEKEMERLQEVYDKREATLWTKYNAMESTLALLQTKSDYFTSVMSSLSGSKSSD